MFWTQQCKLSGRCLCRVPRPCVEDALHSSSYNNERSGILIFCFESLCLESIKSKNCQKYSFTDI